MGGVESIPDEEIQLPYSERCCNWQGKYYEDMYHDDEDSIVAVNHVEDEEGIQRQQQQHQQQDHIHHQQQLQHQEQHPNTVIADIDVDFRNSTSFDVREDSDAAYAEEARDECCSAPCSPVPLRQVPSWLHKREKYERSLVKYHKNKVKYLKKDIARRRRQVLDDQISFSTLFFACMTCNAFSTIDPSTEWVDPSGNNNTPSGLLSKQQQRSHHHHMVSLSNTRLR